MKTLRLNRVKVLAATAMFVVFAGQSTRATVLDKTKDIAGTTLHYKVILPDAYDASKTYPAILAFPPGNQNMDMVEFTLEGNWRAQAERRGYIVVIPAAPAGQLFFKEGGAVFPEFLADLLADYKILDNKFHIAGLSNGGLSAFHVAAMYPQYFWSVTGLPGYLPDPTPEHVAALAKLCIYMYAGELDTRWSEKEKEQAAQFRSLGFAVQFSEEADQPHVMATLQGEGAARLFEQLEASRRGCAK